MLELKFEDNENVLVECDTHKYDRQCKQIMSFNMGNNETRNVYKTGFQNIPISIVNYAQLMVTLEKELSRHRSRFDMMFYQGHIY